MAIISYLRAELYTHPVARTSIRLARPGDLGSIARVHAASIRELCRGHYEARELAEWLAPNPGMFVRLLRHATVFVATRAAEVVGFAAVAVHRREIRAVYVDPSAAGGGLGVRLLQRAERVARALGVRELHLAATLNAVGFYERCGWTRDESGAAPPGRRCVPMRKRLGSGGRKRSL
jgi:GNAT superfamily N-acetyltransferase